MIEAIELMGALELVPLTQAAKTAPLAISGCYIGDLLSNVMGKAEPGSLWLTVMTNPNVVAVAQLLGLAGVVILEGYQPMPEALARAEKEGIPVFSSQHGAYELACRFKKLHLA